MTYESVQLYCVLGIRDEQKRNLLQRARAFASDTISAAELEEARLGNLAASTCLLQYATHAPTLTKPLVQRCYPHQYARRGSISYQDLRAPTTQGRTPFTGSGMTTGKMKMCWHISGCDSRCCKVALACGSTPRRAVQLPGPQTP